MTVRTRVLLISDTHGEAFNIRNEHKVDVVIHCGDLTDQSKLYEYHSTLKLLKELNAPLTLVIAGNHDFTLDTPAFERKVLEATDSLDPELVRKEYGDIGAARRLFDDTPGVTFLDEGTHKFNLHNGAYLSVYASPFTPSQGGGAFQYRPNTGHRFTIEQDTDIVITHGPPRGIMDRTCEGRAGCPNLFAAIARARPRLHCFGHIHEEWGARRIAWRSPTAETPSHFTSIDNEASTTIDTLRNIKQMTTDSPEKRVDKLNRMEQHRRQGYCAASCRYEDRGAYTLFVNAAMEGVTEEFPMHPPWIVDIDLPLSSQGPGTHVELRIP
ncbi:ser/Thr protein phosphatase family protein [Xylaria bambusicola]|uniref:ser/Thr protein phosphatase family protein n=1 Tax=Xylaria bambusicola TaxID=326684 RepID=UPI002008B479|nr:ser/Thr protein phosphatase family protein [Xylaria bambusicola]KAI0508326.1 ser/Thr protein phosphatase family protein [Xylaria bambusicola]